MNKKNYTIDEILSAINELNEKKVKVDIGIKKKSDYLFNSEIPNPQNHQAYERFWISPCVKLRSVDF